jgi:hypothetical protein
MPAIPRFGVARPSFYPPPHPGVTGGDYDRLPQLGQASASRLNLAAARRMGWAGMPANSLAVG